MRISEEIISLLMEIPETIEESGSEVESTYLATANKDLSDYVCLTPVQKAMTITFEKKNSLLFIKDIMDL